MPCPEVDAQRWYLHHRFVNPQCHGWHFALDILHSALCSTGMQLDTIIPRCKSRGISNIGTRKNRTYLLFKGLRNTSSP